MFRRYRIAGFLLFIFLFLGCDRIFPSRDPVEEPQEERVSVRGPLLAQVDSWAIGLDDFRQRIDALGAMLAVEGEGRELSSQDKRNILRELVDLQVLAQVAREKGLDRDRDFRDSVRDFENSLLVQKLQESIMKDIVVTDAEIENFYNTNRFAFQQPEERRIREIVVSRESQIREILISLLRGENFSALARSYSISESSGQGGDLGYIMPDPEERFQRFWEVAFTTDEGETSSYFRGPEGYYIVKVEDVRGGEVIPLGEVRGDIRSFLQAQRAEGRLEDLIYETKQRSRIVINEDLIN